MSPPLAVVLDTNVLVAAGFNRRSSAAQIIRKIRNGKLRLIWHPRTRAEIKRIIRQIPPLSWSWFEDLFTPEGKYDKAIMPDSYGIIPDPDDRKFAALAAVAGAVLVSNDRHLLAVRDDLPITVVPPGELVQSEFA